MSVPLIPVAFRKDDPSSSDVHVDAIMGSGKKKSSISVPSAHQFKPNSAGVCSTCGLAHGVMG